MEKVKRETRLADSVTVVLARAKCLDGWKVEGGWWMVALCRTPSVEKLVTRWRCLFNLVTLR